MKSISQESSLGGKVALVTGASSGIGRAIAVALAGAGVERVVVTARREELLSQLVEVCDVAVPVVCDLADEAAASELPQKAMDAAGVGRLDILVNAAGVGRFARVTDGDPAQWQSMWAINVHALALVTRSALSLFPESGGHVVHVGSLSGHRVPSGGFYPATKFAVRAMAEALRLELRDAGRVDRVTQLSPGFVDTELARGYVGDMGKDFDAMGYATLSPEDVAAAAMYALTAPRNVEVNDILIRPLGQGR